MKVIYEITGQEKLSRGVGLGNFDGLHIGHMALINTLISESEMLGLHSTVYTFIKHPENILRKKLFTPLLTTRDKKIQLLEKTGLDSICFDEFDEEYSRLSPELFVKNILVDMLKAKLVVTGFNYRFGYMGEGDVKCLKQLGSKFGFRTIIIPPVKIDNEVVSSTLIRNYISEGNADRAFKLLGRHYSIFGRVKSGRQIGSRLGFPTANLYPEEYMVLPSNGVYITRTMIDEKLHTSVTNVGVKPTVKSGQKVTVETHIIDFDQIIYDRNIEVFFIKKLRDEKKFESLGQLKAQVEKDIDAAVKYI